MTALQSTLDKMYKAVEARLNTPGISLSKNDTEIAAGCAIRPLLDIHLVADWLQSDALTLDQAYQIARNAGVRVSSTQPMGLLQAVHCQASGVVLSEIVMLVSDRIRTHLLSKYMQLHGSSEQSAATSRRSRAASRLRVA